MVKGLGSGVGSCAICKYFQPSVMVADPITGLTPGTRKVTRHRASLATCKLTGKATRADDSACRQAEY